MIPKAFHKLNLQQWNSPKHPYLGQPVWEKKKKIPPSTDKAV